MPCSHYLFYLTTGDAAYQMRSVPAGHPKTSKIKTYLSTRKTYRNSYENCDIVCSSASSDAIKNWRWSMKVSKAVNLFLDYHKLNSQKKYDQGLPFAFGQIPGSFS
jgi:hypothetical protein